MPITTQHADRSARRHAPWTATVIIAAGLLLVPACTSGTPHPSASPAVSSAGTSTSAGTVPPAAVDSQTVYDRLSRRPITAAELPAGMAAEAPHVESADGPPGALGAIGVKLDDTQTSASDFTVLIYGVFTTGSAAQAAYQQGPAAVLNPRDHTVISSASTTPVGGPTTLSHVRVTDIHGTGRGVAGYSYCAALVGNVIVSGGSGQRGDHLAGNDTLACTLTRIGVNHLRQVTSH